MIEIEYRGPLSDSQCTAITEFLHNNSQSLKSEFEKVIFFDTKDFHGIGDFKGGSARISLKIDNKGCFFRIKDGNAADTARKEYSVELKEKDVPNLIYILSRLGLTYGYYRPTKREDFKFKDLIISIKTECVMGNHFEIEVNESDITKNVEFQILKDKFNLQIWTSDEYTKRVTNLMDDFPPINILDSKIF